MKGVPAHLGVLLGVAAALAVAVRGFEWATAGDDVLWATGCDFIGNDYRQVAMTAPDGCGRECRGDRGGTHFAWNWDRCWLKSAHGVRRYDAIVYWNPAWPNATCGVLNSP